MYSNLIPLETAAPRSLATAFRATNRQSGTHFALRRLHGCPAVSAKRLDLWKAVDHSNVVKLHEYFSTQAFGDHCKHKSTLLCVVHCQSGARSAG